MIRLTREVRCSIQPGFENQGGGKNSWGGWPSPAGLAPYLLIRVTVSGEPNSATGYLADIKEFDRLIRDLLLQRINTLYSRHGSNTSLESILIDLWGPVSAGIPLNTTLDVVEIKSTPFLSYSLHREKADMIQLTEQFEFSASHRLHCPGLSEQENKDLFGKCNNPSGHGHNYVVEVTVEGKPDSTGRLLALPDLEQIVNRAVIDRFDHKHLNEDTVEFRSMNPTVENIARVTWDLLVNAVAPVTLRNVRIYETPKTWADYSGA